MIPTVYFHVLIGDNAYACYDFQKNFINALHMQKNGGKI